MKLIPSVYKLSHRKRRFLWLSNGQTFIEKEQYAVYEWTRILPECEDEASSISKKQGAWDDNDLFEGQNKDKR